MNSVDNQLNGNGAENKGENIPHPPSGVSANTKFDLAVTQPNGERFVIPKLYDYEDTGDDCRCIILCEDDGTCRDAADRAIEAIKSYLMLSQHADEIEFKEFMIASITKECAKKFAPGVTSISAMDIIYFKELLKDGVYDETALERSVDSTIEFFKFVKPIALWALLDFDAIMKVEVFKSGSEDEVLQALRMNKKCRVVSIVAHGKFDSNLIGGIECHRWKTLLASLSGVQAIDVYSCGSATTSLFNWFTTRIQSMKINGVPIRGRTQLTVNTIHLDTMLPITNLVALYVMRRGSYPNWSSELTFGENLFQASTLAAHNIVNVSDSRLNPEIVI